MPRLHLHQHQVLHDRHGQQGAHQCQAHRLSRRGSRVQGLGHQPGQGRAGGQHRHGPKGVHRPAAEEALQVGQVGGQELLAQVEGQPILPQNR